jgi:hypothetical protein
MVVSAYCHGQLDLSKHALKSFISQQVPHHDDVQGSTRCYPKVPEIPLLKLYHLMKFLFVPIPFKIVPFGIDTSIPVGFP